MRTTPLPSDSWREALKFISRCPLCSTAYNQEQAQLFAKTGEASFVHLTCPSCQSFFIAMVVVMGPGISSVGMVSDLSVEDARRVHGLAPFSLNEAISGYQLLIDTTRFNSLLFHQS